MCLRRPPCDSIIYYVILMSQLSHRGLIRVFEFLSVGVGSGCMSVPSLNQSNELNIGSTAVEHQPSVLHVVNVSETAVDPPASETKSSDARLIQDSDLESQIRIEPGGADIPDISIGQ